MSTVPLFAVEAPGLLTTIQDAGRAGHQREGLPPAGAMDPFAASTTNLLVGNGRGAATLEITLLGPALRALSDVRVALCGADLSARLDGLPLPLWRTAIVRAGVRLSFGRRVSGARAYLAVAGGFDVPAVLGSRATFLRGGMGGLNGRPLRAGDALEGVRGGEQALPWPGRGLRPGDIPAYPLPAVLRVLPGPHPEAFAADALAAFADGIYTLSPRSDRQGYRLDGPVVSRAGGDILSEAMPLGGLQVPPDGRPILLMADRQTTGGYPLLAVVISTDLPRAAQIAPGDTVRFVAVTLEEAQAAAVAQERWLRIVETGANPNSAAQKRPAAR